MDWRGCPAKFKYKVIDKLVEPPNAAMARGSDIHKKAEDFVTGKLKKMPDELKLFEQEFKLLKGQKIKIVEDQWAFKADWTDTVWNDWAGCWLRVKLDVAYVNVTHNALVPIDHKTGKYREEKNEEYLLQLELYGLSGLLKYPTIDVVSPRLWYLDHGIIHPDPEKDDEIEYFRKDLPDLKKRWEARVKPYFADKTFRPTPGAACTYCHFRKANGGPCKY
jgi:CRISPR/Cas system-associated exonuclease Cas4 (RecB family)